MGYRVAPANFVSAFLVNVTTAGSVPSARHCIRHTLAAVAGGFLVKRFAGDLAAYSRAQDIMRFSLLAGVVSTAIGATIGVASCYL